MKMQEVVADFKVFYQKMKEVMQADERKNGGEKNSVLYRLP